jgi:putative nucleotidyltransferase with HDIG domain
MLSRKIKNKAKEIVNIDNANVKSIKNENFFNKYFNIKNNFAQRLYIFILTFAVVVSIISYNFTPDLGVKLNQPSPKTIKANKTIQFEDVAKTEEDRNKREIEVEDVYNYDPQVLNGPNGVIYQIKYFFQLAKIISKKDLKTIDDKVYYFASLVGNEYSNDTLKTTLLLDFQKNSLLMDKTINFAKTILKDNIKPNDVDSKKIEAAQIVSNDNTIDQAQKNLIIEILQKNIKPTAIYDPVATENARKKAREETPPHIVTINEGQTVISEGDIVNENDILILTKLGLLNKGFNWKIFSFINLINAMVLFLFYFYIFKFNKNIFNNTKKLLITSTIIVIFIALAKLFTILTKLHLNLWVYLFPLIAASMLCSIIFDTRVSIVLSMVLAINLGIAANFDYQLSLIYLLGAIFASFMVSNISQRNKIMKGGFYSSLFLAFLFFTSNLIGGDIKTILLYSVLGIVNGVVSAIITIGLLPFIESTFRIVTAMGLLELSHTDQPLLKELLINAPGTYNHSLLVSHLAESCANAIGADALLVKVAALYHDLGKMKRPEYFYENQLNIENIHDKLNPSMSKNIIANHIKDGVEIAIKNNIPKKIIDLISQHHGNSVITYFYNKQKGMESDKILNPKAEEIMEGHFRYPAKKPQTKEAAILMLADSSEAAVRSIEKITPKKIEQMVNDIIDSKISDGQLSEADITIKEINIVKNTLIDGLISIYHSRIAYPNSQLKLVTQ